MTPTRDHAGNPGSAPAPVAHWDPALYLRFAREREQPGHALLAMVREAAAAGSDFPHGFRHVVDLGCGSGALTRQLAALFPAARVTGMDSSPEMLAVARMVPADSPVDEAHLRWQHGRIEDFAADDGAAPLDLLFSNAALHWVADQLMLWPGLMRRLRPGGLLAVQVPRATAPWRSAIATTCADPRWAGRLATPGAPAVVPAPAELYGQLAPFCAVPELRETIWWHILPTLDDAVDWLRGAALRPALSVLDPESTEAFLAALRAALDPLLARGPAGEILFPFPRLFVLARRM